MCGIAGLIGGFDEQHSGRALGNMLENLRHRGPDDGGLTVFPAGQQVVGLGNRRLAILDLSALGHQPMSNPDNGDVVVYNGEIYNSPDLRKTLEQRGLSFRGRSDTEVLLRAYEQWGVECLARLKGMFAFAIWDSQRSRLVLARDHLGIKPLYYTVVPGKGILFASEIRALLASGFIPVRVDRRGLAGLLAYGSVQEPLTILEGVVSLPPASLLEIGPGGDVIARDRYWRVPRPEPEKRNMVLHDVVEQGRDVLKAAVRRHLLSDVRLGVFLSSGLDSTALLGLVREVAGQRVDAFTVSFPEDPGRDEAPIARATAKRLGVGYHECPVDSKTALEWAREGLDRMDQPGLDGLNVYMVSRAVRREGIVVALSGQGGDEVFGGYPSFREIPRLKHRINRLSLLPAGLRTAVVRLATARMNGFVKSKAQELAATRPDTRDLYFGYKRLLASDDLARMGFHPSSLGLTSSFHLPNVCQDEWTIGDDLVASVGRLELAYFLGNTLLRDGDVFGMANSLEIRVPFLDIDVVDWAFRLPGDVILPSNAPSKFLLRKIGSDFYNGAQTRLAKRGFTPPWSTWLLGPLRQLMEEGVCSLRDSGLIAEEGFNKTREAFFREPDRGTWSRIWTLVVLGHWLRKNGQAPSVA